MNHLRVHVQNTLQILDGQRGPDVIEEISEGIVRQGSKGQATR